MARRLLSLLFVACACSAAAVTVAAARAQKPVPIAHIPAIPAAGVVGARCPVPARFRPAFEQAARKTRLPLALLTAVASVESEFEPQAVSTAGARGLLQVLPTTAQELRLDADHPAQNVLAGARYLRRQFDAFPSSDLALAAYNAGPGAVAAAGGAPSTETLGYVREVTALWRRLAGCR
jgi:soluble lytic murein transglycosylase-like protein